ncbi:hypothetical protein KGM_202143B, partial [Danaus plexippus plexippus]
VEVTRHVDQIRKPLRTSSSEEPDWDLDIVEDVASLAAIPPLPDTQPRGREYITGPIVPMTTPGSPATTPRNVSASRGHRRRAINPIFSTPTATSNTRDIVNN